MFKNLSAVILFLFMTTMPAKAADATAMVFWAEWCSACRLLDPALDQAVSTYEGDVEIVRLDFTRMDLASLAREAEKAEAIGASDYVPLTNVKTGYALLIVDGDVKGRISAGMSEELMHMAFDAAITQ